MFKDIAEFSSYRLSLLNLKKFKDLKLDSMYLSSGALKIFRAGNSAKQAYSALALAQSFESVYYAVEEGVSERFLQCVIDTFRHNVYLAETIVREGRKK